MADLIAPAPRPSIRPSRRRSLASRMWKRLRNAARWRVRRLIGGQRSADGFNPDPCVISQTLQFKVEDQIIYVESDHRTPLYEMVSELAGIDCYGLAGLGDEFPEGAVVIDAGANVGVTSLVLAARFKRRVLALEPVPDNREYLIANLRRNGESRVETFACGLAGSDRHDRLWQDPAQSVSAHFNDMVTEKRPSGLRFIDAEFLSLDTLLKRAGATEIAILKMDIEGGEHEVIDSLKPSLAGRIHAISLEAHDLEGGRTVESLAKRLKFLNYSVVVRPHIGSRRGLHYISARRRRE